jgi:hypothetical protein
MIIDRTRTVRLPPHFKHILMALCLLVTSFFTLTASPKLMAVSVTPMITVEFGENVGYALRNDGLLFQFGGNFMAAEISFDDPSLYPQHAQNVILTNVVSISTIVNQENYPDHFRSIAITATGQVFTWQANGFGEQAQPRAIPDLLQVKEVISPDNQQHFAVTKTGTIFHLDLKNLSATEISGLSDLKRIVLSNDDYYALNNAGALYYGQWDWHTEQFAPPIPVVTGFSEETLSNVVSVEKKVFSPGVFALTETGEVHSIIFENKAEPINNLSAVKELYLFKDFNNLALAETHQVYILHTFYAEPIQEFSDVKRLYFRELLTPLLALTNSGNVYHLPRTGENIKQIQGLSNIKTLFYHPAYETENFFFALNDNNEFYVADADFIERTPRKIEALGTLKEIERYVREWESGFLLLTEDGKLYNWTGWNIETDQFASPVQVSDWTDVVAVEADDRSVLILRENGMLCGFGDHPALGLINVSIDAPQCDLEKLKLGSVGGNQYTFSLNIIGQGTVISDDTKINCPEFCSAEYLEYDSFLLSPSPDSGFIFSGWEGDCQTYSDSPLVQMTESLNCTARFETAPEPQLTINTAGAGKGIVTGSVGLNSGIDCGATCTETYSYETEITLGTQPEADSRFVGWSGDADCADRFTITEDLSCTATFELLPTYTLTVTTHGTGAVSGTGIDCGSDCTEDYFSGTEVTLTATPETGSSFLGWHGDCEASNNQVLLTLDQNRTCNATFGQSGTPQISVSPKQLQIGARVGASASRTVTISNTGNGGLTLGQVEIAEAGDYVLNDDKCSQTILAPSGECEITVTFQPQSNGSQNATLLIPSNDTIQSSLNVSLQADTCSGGSYSPYIDVYPRRLDFGTEVVGESIALSQQVHAWSEGCDSLEVEEIQFTGTHSTEFTVKNKQCYYGGWKNNSYSSCQFTVVFSPTSANTKDVQMALRFNHSAVSSRTVPITAKALSSGTAQIAVSPDNHDFGTVKLQRGGSNSQAFTVTNSGDINLKFDAISLTGSDADDFKLNNWGCGYQPFLQPNQTCTLDAQFLPLSSAGVKEAVLNFASNAPSSTPVTLTGTVSAPADCSGENVTIESAAQGSWDSPETWQLDRIPTETDVVLIKSGHQVTGLPFAKVKALCIENGATLKSPDNQGSALEIQAIDTIENQGTIVGQNGGNESGEACDQAESIGTATCAYPGASVILKVGSQVKTYGKSGDQWWYAYSSGGPIMNTGEIRAGHGGQAHQYAAPGGDAIVLGRHTVNKGLIQAGNGGNLLGTGSGQAGQGGVTQIWGKLGGSGSLYNQNGAKALAGQGGNCQPGATAAQTGGKGGNLWLVSLPNVYLNGGIQKAGSGGSHCLASGGTNGLDGWVRIEPSVIDLSGSGTQVKGGNILIYGGDDWTLNLSDLAPGAIEATGDITLAVGDGGVIDLTGNTASIFKSTGQVNLFANSLMLDDKQSLFDLIETDKPIIVGPSKRLRDMSLAGTGKASGEPEETVSVNLTLSNNGPDTDTYTLAVTDSANWTLGQLPASVEVEGLSALDLALNVTLPTTRGASNVMSVSATSEADSGVTARVDIPVIVAMESNSSETGNDDNSGDNNSTGDAGNSSAGSSSGSQTGNSSAGSTGSSSTGSSTGSQTTGTTSDSSSSSGSSTSSPPQTGNDANVEASTTNGTENNTTEAESPSDTTASVTPEASLDNKTNETTAEPVATPENTPPTANHTSTPVPPATGAGNHIDGSGESSKVTDSQTTAVPEKTQSATPDITNAPIQTATGNHPVNNSDQETTDSSPTTSASSPSSEKTDPTGTPSDQPATGSNPLGNTVIGFPISSARNCPSTGKIDRMCHHQGRVLKDITITPQASVTQARLAGRINNQGLISQVTVEAGAEVNGGQLSGYITNEGTLANFEFVGARLTGGTLAGTIVNKSKVGGYIKDVDLAADTMISGGYLQGKITGKCDAPSFLEKVEIKADSQLSGVIIGDAVKWDDKVSFGQCVQFANLPNLGEGVVLTLADKTVSETKAEFTGGVLYPNHWKGIKANIKHRSSEKELLAIHGKITVDPAHIGQTAQILVHVAYWPNQDTEVFHFMLDENGQAHLWDVDQDNNVVFQNDIVLQASQYVPLYTGPLNSEGIFKIRFGYRLSEGDIVHNAQSIDLIVTP